MKGEKSANQSCRAADPQESQEPPLYIGLAHLRSEPRAIDQCLLQRLSQKVAFRTALVSRERFHDTVDVVSATVRISRMRRSNRCLRIQKHRCPFVEPHDGATKSGIQFQSTAQKILQA